MDQYEKLMTVLNTKDELTIEDVKDIYNSFVETATNFKYPADKNIEVETIKYCNYLNDMYAVFADRYQNSKMSAEEYQIWKKVLEEDFCEIPEQVKKELKRLFIQKIAQIINNKKNYRDLSLCNNYDDYFISDIKDVEFNQISIHYKYRVVFLLIITVILLFIIIFVK